MKEIYDAVADDGLKGVLIVFFLVVSYKLWKMKSASELSSDCCDGFHFKANTSNEGGNLNITDEHINHTDNISPNNNNV